MAIEPTTYSNLSSTAAGSSTASTQLTADYESFLKLLTAQVANQDPLEPMDSTTFVSQLAQLSQVEQSIQTNANLEQINVRLAAAGALSDIQLIGHEVTLATDTIELRDGSAAFEFELNEPAQSVTARIMTEDGTVVRTLSGLNTSADTAHAVTWDGYDNQGLLVPDAVFKVAIDAVDAEDTAISASTYASTEVEELTFETGQSVMVLRNGDQALSGSVIAIR
ncbi:MAG: hypothetical protein CML02_20190 [Pseudooceanicola sp.]|jgi:flagellar basal-body rod modification protein FlgD|nr:hypothetical protein [Pseudooceanicola sp.]|tara:strand:+ start:481 stop:1149 length:669 start_codon:yes stop_codon:yes gene_type:complete